MSARADADSGRPARTLNYLTLALAFLAAIQACILWQQTTVIRKDQRPWIRPYVEIAPVPFPVVKLNARFSMVNSGKTPATHVHAKYYFLKVRTDETLTELPEDHPGGEASSGVLFPNLPHDGSFADIYVPTQEEIQELAANKLYFVLYANVTYSDYFGKDHFTKFCEYIHPNFGSGYRYDTTECTINYQQIDSN